MKRTEFIEAVKNLNIGLTVSYEYYNEVYIPSKNGNGTDKVIDVAADTICSIDTWSGMRRLSEINKRKLFDIAYQYSITPLEDRK